MESPDESDSTSRVVQVSPNLDATANWNFFADEVARSDPARARQFPVLLRLKGGRADTLEQRINDFLDAKNRNRTGGPPLKRPRLQVAGFNKRRRGSTPPADIGESYFSVLSDSALFDLISDGGDSSDPQHPLNDLFILGHGISLPDDAVGAETPLPAPQVPQLPPKPGLVITAVIDTGLPFLNTSFRDGPDSTRVRYAWVQDGQARPPAQQHVPHGREFTKAQIDAMLVSANANGPVTDELAAYRKQGLADFTRPSGHSLGFRSTHGGYTAGAAAGYPMEEANSDQALIFVQLPDAVVADASGATLEPYFIAAVDYILDRADRIAEAENCGKLPVVINFSFGGTGGPLDGTSPIEQFMDAVIKTRNTGDPGQTAILLPAGNSYLSQCHAKFTEGVQFKGPDKTEKLRWRVQPDDHTSNIVEIWTPRRLLPGQSVLEVGLTRPFDTSAPLLLPEMPNTAIDLLQDGQIIARVSYEWVGAPTNRGKFTLIVQATATLGSPQVLAPAGRWEITLKDVGLKKDAHVDAWVLRDDELPRFDTDARQSYFTDPLYRVWTEQGFPEVKDQPGSPVIRAGLQNVLATGEEPVVIGGYVDRSGRPALYTSGGLTNTPDRKGPDALCVSDDSIVHWGVLSGLVLSGGKAPANGTSMSAPQLAKRLAQMLALGGNAARADRQRVKVMAVHSENNDFGGRAPKPDVERGGAGRIQLVPQNDRRYQP